MDKFKSLSGGLVSGSIHLTTEQHAIAMGLGNIVNSLAQQSEQVKAQLHVALTNFDNFIEMCGDQLSLNSDDYTFDRNTLTFTRTDGK